LESAPLRRIAMDSKTEPSKANGKEAFMLLLHEAIELLNRWNGLLAIRTHAELLQVKAMEAEMHPPKEYPEEEEEDTEWMGSHAPRKEEKKGPPEPPVVSPEPLEDSEDVGDEWEWDSHQEPSIRPEHY
jgi:hypothetical protein